MEISQLLDWGFSFYRQYPVLCYGLAAVLLVVTLWKPFKVLKAAFLLLVLAICLYIGLTLINTMKIGVENKNRGAHRLEQTTE